MQFAARLDEPNLNVEIDPDKRREVRGAGSSAGAVPAFPHNRKRPSGEEGRFWGYYREERYMYLYICGSVGGR
jgi:hypothetical protein